MSELAQPLLQIAGLRVSFGAGVERVDCAVRGVDLEVAPGEIVGIVGESGSGKSLTCRSILRLLPDGAAVVGGTVTHSGRDVLALDAAQLREFRAREIGVVFQDPFSTLNPTLRVGRQMVEALRVSTGLDREAAAAAAVALLADVDIADPQRVLNSYPHELSGGMRQRVLIAIAMGAKPKLLIADEPTTALDVTTQAQILRLLRRVRDAHGTGILLVTHDFGVISEMCDRVVVMYDGFVVESGTIEQLYASPMHPYTRALIAAIPDLRIPTSRSERRAAIPGPPPGTVEYLGGCPFSPRCAFASPQCDEVTMELETMADGRAVACPFTTIHGMVGARER